MSYSWVFSLRSVIHTLRYEQVRKRIFVSPNTECLCAEMFKVVHENPRTKLRSGMKNFLEPGGCTNLSTPFPFACDGLMETYLFQVKK